MTIVDRARVAAALPSYTIGDEIGSGAFGVVLAARHGALDRPVAVKVLTNTMPQAAANFLTEARTLAQFDHPHIVRSYDYVTHDDLCLLVMELLAGGTLARRQLPLPAACAVGLAVADALAFSHGRGVLHRDIKPANILLAGTGQPKLVDFGIAKILEGSAVSASQVIGSPRYMAPEQIRGERLSAAVDLFGLSTALYELMSGTTTAPARLPVPELLRLQLDVLPPPPPGVPLPLAGVVMRGLAKNPAERHPDAHAFAVDLARAATDVFGRGWLADTGVPLGISEGVRSRTSGQPPARSLVACADGERSEPPVPGAPKVPAPGRRRAGPLAAAMLALAVAAGAALGGGVSWAAAGNQHPALSAPARVAAWLPGPLALGTITTVAGNADSLKSGFAGDGGRATSAAFHVPAGLAIDPARGDLYIADRFNNRIRRVDAHGIVTTVAGDGITGFRGDGGPAIKAELNSPTGVAVAPDGSLYIADARNCRIRRVDSHGIITTVAGTGIPCYASSAFSAAFHDAYRGDGIPALDAELADPAAIAFDGQGDLYIADSGDDRIRRVDPRGIITTVAGTGGHGFSGDGGPATAAMFRFPTDIAFGPDGSLYIVDLVNERVRRVSPQGVVTTIAGTGTRGTAAEEGPALDAQLDLGTGALTVDQAGDVYVTSARHVLRIDTRGKISPVAGIGKIGLLGDGGPASKATIAQPASLALDDGVLYVTDNLINLVRAVRVAPPSATRPSS